MLKLHSRWNYIHIILTSMRFKKQQTMRDKLLSLELARLNFAGYDLWFPTTKRRRNNTTIPVKLSHSIGLTCTPHFFKTINQKLFWLYMTGYSYPHHHTSSPNTNEWYSLLNKRRWFGKQCTIVAHKDKSDPLKVCNLKGFFCLIESACDVKNEI